jgi:hypothetical protein
MFPESKYVTKATSDINGNSISNTTGVISLMNGVAEGHGVNQRIGRNIVVTDIQVKGEWVYPMSSVYNTPSQFGKGIQMGVRTMIIVDRQCNGSAPLASDFLDGNTGLTNGWTIVGYNETNADRFHILYDKTSTLEAEIMIYDTDPTVGITTDIVAYGKRNLPLDIALKCEIPVQYKGTGNTVSSINSNAIYLCLFSDKGHSLLNNANCAYYEKCKFID